MSKLPTIFFRFIQIWTITNILATDSADLLQQLHTSGFTHKWRYASTRGYCCFFCWHLQGTYFGMLKVIPSSSPTWSYLVWAFLPMLAFSPTLNSFKTFCSKCFTYCEYVCFAYIIQFLEFICFAMPFALFVLSYLYYFINYSWWWKIVKYCFCTKDVWHPLGTCTWPRAVKRTKVKQQETPVALRTGSLITLACRKAHIIKILSVYLIFFPLC